MHKGPHMHIHLELSAYNPPEPGTELYEYLYMVVTLSSINPPLFSSPFGSIQEARRIIWIAFLKDSLWVVAATSVNETLIFDVDFTYALLRWRKCPATCCGHETLHSHRQTHFCARSIVNFAILILYAENEGGNAKKHVRYPQSMLSRCPIYFQPVRTIN